MNQPEEIPYNPPGLDEYIAEGARKNAALIQRLEAVAEAVKQGYGGVMPNGGVVDRRKHPEAAPIPANPHLNTPEPKPV